MFIQIFTIQFLQKQNKTVGSKKNLLQALCTVRTHKGCCAKMMQNLAFQSLIVWKIAYGSRLRVKLRWNTLVQVNGFLKLHKGIKSFRCFQCLLKLEWGGEHDKCQKWHCRKMRAGAALTPGDSSLLKERDKHPVYLCFVLFIYMCVWVCERESVFDKSSSALWELCLCYSDNGALTQMKKIPFFLLCQTLLSFLPLLSAFLPHIHSLSDSQFVYLSIPHTVSYPLPLSSLFFISFSSSVFISSLMNIGIWAAENEEKGAASVEGESRDLLVQRNGDRGPG